MRRSDVVVVAVLTFLAVGSAATAQPAAGRSAAASEAKQALRLRLLRSVAGGDPLPIRTRLGAVTELRLDLPAAELAISKQSTPDQAARSVLLGLADLFRISRRPDDYLVKRTGKDRFRTLTYRQYHDGVPVYGSWLQVRLGIEERTVTRVLGVYGRYVPDLRILLREQGLELRIEAERVGVVP